MKISKVTKRTWKRVKKLDKKYLGLDLREIKFYEYEPDEGDSKVAWSDVAEKSVYLNPDELPSSPAYAAFILAREVAHVRLIHKGKRKRPRDELDASLCAQFILADKVGSKKAKSLALRWVNDGLGLLKKTEKKKVVKMKASAPEPSQALASPTKPAQTEATPAQAETETSVAAAPSEEPGQ